MNDESPPSKPKRSEEPPEGQDEKAEKFPEKEAEKRRDLTEKYRDDPVGAIVWAVILILAGVVFLLSNAGALPQIGSADAGHWIAFGVGLILLVEIGVRLTSPEHARPITGRLIFAVILLVIGLSGVFENADELFLPLALILVGVVLLASLFLRR